MPEYQLQIKQVVDYPRCRIYREFIHKLINDRSIRINGGSGLFHFTVLCSYANFRTSYRHAGVRGRSGSLFSQWYRKPVGQLYRTLLPLGAVTRYCMPDTEKAGRSWVYLYHIVSRPAWKRDLPAKLPVHHV